MVADGIGQAGEGKTPGVVTVVMTWMTVVTGGGCCCCCCCRGEKRGE